jgi:hypothetical protein
MGEIVPELAPDQVFVIGHPAKSAIDAIPAQWRDRAVDLGGDRRDPGELLAQVLERLGPDSSLVAVGNIHGQGELFLERLAELPAGEPDEAEEEDGGFPAETFAAPAAYDYFAPDPWPQERRVPSWAVQGEYAVPEHIPAGYAPTPYPPTDHVSTDHVSTDHVSTDFPSWQNPGENPR